MADYFINELGARPQDGFANRPWDNVGVQYGLNALMSGAITAAQFVDINLKIGSRDIDYNPISPRVAADPPSIPVAYQGGLFNEGNNMTIPILDLRGHDIEEIHHDYRSYVMRARLDKANGNHNNQIIWTGPIPLVGDTTFATEGLTVMDQWLSNIQADQRNVSLATKVADDKPAAAHDRCTDGDGHDLPNQTICTTIYPFYQEPRMVAGEPFTGDFVKCQLKPLVRSDYFPIQFTDDQWGELQATFSTGVCDYTKPGIDQQPTTPWMSYANGPGGQPLPPPPAAMSMESHSLRR